MSAWEVCQKIAVLRRAAVRSLIWRMVDVIDTVASWAEPREAVSPIAKGSQSVVTCAAKEYICVYARVKGPFTAIVFSSSQPYSGYLTKCTRSHVLYRCSVWKQHYLHSPYTNCSVTQKPGLGHNLHGVDRYLVPNKGRCRMTGLTQLRVRSAGSFHSSKESALGSVQVAVRTSR